MRLHNVIHDTFKRHYYWVHVMGDPPLQTDIEPKDFWNAQMAERFVDWLDVYLSYWQRLVSDCPFQGHDFANNTLLEQKIDACKGLIVNISGKNLSLELN